ncbi:MAG: ATP-binding cassette domain-containing protein, partial [Planctomycetes bacterium]|nr:ATP-binding cassette domain-containing protein [Planctomycetota bacterium]
MNAPSRPPALRFSGFRVGYRTGSGTRWILDSVDLDVPTGELVLLLGPSGGGKSTLIGAILGLDDPHAPSLRMGGTLEVLGQPVTGPLPRGLRGRVGAVFQEGALIDDLSVRENIELAVREIADPERKVAPRVDGLLERVGLAHPPSRVAALSGGQRKRIALARSLAGDPALLVLDEPTAGLDPRGAEEIARLIREVHDGSSVGRTTIIITHDLEAFRSVADRALFIDPRAGTLRGCTVEELEPSLARMIEAESIPAGPPAVEPLSWRQR